MAHRPAERRVSSVPQNQCPGQAFAVRCITGTYALTVITGAICKTTHRTPMRMPIFLYRAYWTPAGEDCLRLNVWTPELAASTRKRPVMVYMHGGGFSGGSGHDLLAYDGENLAHRNDVVVVTHNHRLNVFGYLNLPRSVASGFKARATRGCSA